MEKLNICPVCSKDRFKAYLSCIDHTVSHETFQIVQCESCGFRFTNPRPEEKEIGRYYQSEEYISHSDTNTGFINKLYQTVRNYTIKRKVKLINKLTLKQESANKNLLDIGCGTAEFIYACKVDGWNVTGIEPSEIARRNAEKKYGIIALEQEKLFELNEKKFNVITLWHVLEHVHQLEKTMEQIKTLLLDDGVLIVAVPNCDSWDAKKYGKHWAAWDLPRHLYHFTEKNIEALFGKLGFRLEKVLPMKFDSFYVSLLSQKLKTGNPNMILGFINGLISNLSANRGGYSSHIYILRTNF
jgi:2-polyprenyl-3-methyl-5-hydroxy-6-metoxy-1,4-benzoquinol methylase